MASGITHRRVTTIAALGLGAMGVVLHGNSARTWAMVAGCLAGTVIHPDLDQESHVSALWLPYARAIPHRHWMSHGPVVGTIGRLLYLAPLFLAILWPVFFVAQWNVNIDLYDVIVVGDAVMGLVISDTLHWAVDVISTSLKIASSQKKRPARWPDGN